MSVDGVRDFIGYGRNAPDPMWPGGARLAVNFVLNYEEGAEYSLLNGDAHGETILGDLHGIEPTPGVRNPNIESAYEFGSRVGARRVADAFARRQLPLTIYAVGRALELNPEFGAMVRERGYDVVGHGWRWIDYQGLSAEEERDHIRRCVDIIEEQTGTRPRGWYTGRPSTNTRRLVVEEGGFLYDCDAYNDELPYWIDVEGRPHLIICHCLDTNDARYARAPGFSLGSDFSDYLRDSIDFLHSSSNEKPKLLTIAFHGRLIGRPGRMQGLLRLLDYVQSLEDVWICRRIEVAEHWYANHAPEPGACREAPKLARFR